MSKIGFDLGFPPEQALRAADNRLVMPYCLVGLEFEFERVTQGLPMDAPWTTYWQGKRDHSLHDAGMEFVFRRPIFGADVVAAVEGLCAYALRARYRVSIRTGLHVHVDVRDLEMHQLVNLCALYALFERAIYRYIGDNRDENVFCLPWYKAHGTVLKINKIVTSDGPTLRNSASRLQDEKYAGLNLDPLSRFGSVEFRHSLTTPDVARVLDWVNICLRFKQAACELGTQAAGYAAFVHDRSPEQLADLVFQDQFRLLDYEGFGRDVIEEGVPVMLDVLAQIKQGWGGVKSNLGSACFDKWALSHKGGVEEQPPRQTKKKPLRIPLRGNPTPRYMDEVGGPDGLNPGELRQENTIVWEFTNMTRQPRG